MNSTDAGASRTLRILGARQHNLKNFDLELPRGGLTVISGVSGSGKSSLAFDTLYAEGQRRYVESVSSYARQFLERLPRPDVDAIHGLTPAVAIRQIAPARSARSTVGTATELHDYLRLLFARLGTVHCGTCGRAVAVDSPGSIAREAEGWEEGEPLLVLAPVERRRGIEWPEQAAQLVAAGFTRALIGEAVVPLDPPPEDLARAATIRVVVDRFTFRRSEIPRLVDSCEQAFRRGEGKLELCRGSRPAETRDERWACRNCGAPAVRPEPSLFSFNSPYGVCPECRGFGNVLTFTQDKVVPDPDKTLREGALDPWARSWRKVAWPKLEKLASARRISLDTPWRKLAEETRTLLLEGGDGFRGVYPFLRRLQEKSYKIGNRFIVKRYQTPMPCGSCGGTRLRAEALRVRLAGLGIAQVSAMTVVQAAAFVRGLEFSPREREIAGPVLHELDSRLRFLERVDLGYLTLDRMTRTLSGGEAQRIELANALGAQLADTLYVLDEPTVGLHPRDTERLIGILEDLASRGNTLVVVEHEPAVLRAADHLVDMGPGAGERGGEVLYSGAAGAALEHVATETARYLRGEARIFRASAGPPDRGWLEIVGARHHNLRGETVEIPLGRLTAVTGVSGSGKSSLIEEVLARAAVRHFEHTEPEPVGDHDAIRGFERLKRVVLVDQSPIGRTARSCPVTYLGAYAPLRDVFARQPAAIARGLRDGAFSFNTAGGRCDTCEGAGWVTVEMYFLADLLVPCDRCGGARFRDEVLGVRYRGLNIHETLELTADQAFEHFAREPRFTRAIHILRRVGLGYLRLGQPANTLSGGEAQRLKIARELGGRGGSPALYLLDEPTVGLHFADVQRLLEVLDELVRRGDTVVLVEHNLDVIRNCDWVIDLGPDGGDRGGALVAAGPPGAIAFEARSHTGRFLREAGVEPRAFVAPAAAVASVAPPAGRAARVKRAAAERRSSLARAAKPRRANAGPVSRTARSRSVRREPAGGRRSAR